MRAGFNFNTFLDRLGSIRFDNANLIDRNFLDTHSEGNASDISGSALRSCYRYLAHLVTNNVPTVHQQDRLICFGNLRAHRSEKCTYSEPHANSTIPLAHLGCAGTTEQRTVADSPSLRPSLLVQRSWPPRFSPPRPPF